jgi:hypothetical protein
MMLRGSPLRIGRAVAILGLGITAQPASGLAGHPERRGLA